MRLSLWLLVLALLPAPAFAEGACDAWFPDFAPQCERAGRFEGFEKPIVAPYLFEDVTLSVAYERPVTEPKGIFQQRITSALVLEF
jgi:hypothetical protein